MAQFRYKARTHHGEAVEGVLEASSSEVAADQLFNGGLTPIDITPLREPPDALAELRRQLGLERAGLTDLIMLSRQLYTLLHAGVPIIRAIRGLADTTRNTLIVRTLEQTAGQLEAGRPLAECLRAQPRVFSSLYVSIIQVGESTGQLDAGFQQMARYLEREKQTRDRIKAALRYPAFVIFAIAAAIGVINVMVIPAFASVFARLGSDLPWQTVVLVKTSELTLAWWPQLLAGLVLAALGLRFYLRTVAGRYRWDQIKLRLPLVGGIVGRATLGRFARSFSMALGSGVPLLQSLGVVASAVDNYFMEERILAMRSGIERGETLTRAAAASGLFTPLVLQMLAVGEETGAVGEMLEQVADYYEREVDYDLQRLAAAIEPILITVIGALVLVLALGVFLPMWDLAGVALHR